ncbi:MAG: copper chaperone PCu(A)C [Candidatus Eisenbacteria bacterium]|nr:copper chaperone PCu(A)C [Candidatus Eisenbacteria bacterium]
MNRRTHSLSCLVLVAIVGMAAITGCTQQPGRLPAASEGAARDAGVEIRALHARPSPDGVTVGAIFTTFRSDAGDTLVGLSVPAEVAGRIEIHSMVANAEGQMEMHEIPVLALPAGEDVELKPGGMHLMLFQLARPLVEGQSFPLTLRFARGGEKVIEVPIRED